jgi:sugar O-acyltransferase (sialic acid O-acetyltransferase NeuD family)
MADVVIFGVGRGADVATRYLRHDSDHKITGYTVDDDYVKEPEFNGLPVVAFSKVTEHFSPSTHRMFAPMGFQGMNSLRAEKYLRGKTLGYEFISYVSSRVSSFGTLNVGENCFILENNVFNFDVKIGNNVVMWSGNQIGDLSVLHDHVWLSSHVVLSGEVEIEEYAFLGINATVSNNVKVGAKCYVGANALITKNTEPNSVYTVAGTKKSFADSSRFLEVISS